MTPPCPCDACSLRERLEERLAELDKITPLNEALRQAQWHRMDELQLALGRKQQPYTSFRAPMAAKPKSSA